MKEYVVAAYGTKKREALSGYCFHLTAVMNKTHLGAGIAEGMG